MVRCSLNISNEIMKVQGYIVHVFPWNFSGDIKISLNKIKMGGDFKLNVSL